MLCCQLLISTVAAAEVEALLLAVAVNGTEEALLPVLRRADGLYLRTADFARLKIVPPAVPPVAELGHAYLPLDAVAGLAYRLDMRATRLVIDCASACFQAQALSARRAEPAATATGSPALILNYDLLAEIGDHSRLGSLVEAVVSSGGLSADTTMFARDVGERLVRLESGVSVDWPQRLVSLRAGDSYTVPGSWGIPVRFGGLQLASDFELQPGFVSFPTLELAGDSSLPSTVDIYVDGVRRYSEQVQGGPFTIADVAPTMGAGEVRAVVTDLLGRQQVISAPYYATARLLRPGLAQFAVGGGLLRDDFGRASNHYEEPFLSSLIRHGLSKSTTGEARVEVSGRRQAIGTGLVHALPGWGAVDLALAGSDGERGAGALTRLAYEWSAARFSLAVSSRLATKRFMQQGLALDAAPPRHSTGLQLGFSFGEAGRTTLSYLRRDERERADLSLLSLGHALRIGRAGTLNLSAFTTLEPQRASGAALVWTVPLGASSTASARLRADDDGRLGLGARLHQRPPAPYGLGYRIAFEDDDGAERLEAGLAYEAPAGRFEAEVGRTERAQQARLGARGGMVLSGGRLFATRQVQDSFAVVDAGYPGLDILRDHRPVGRTGADGVLLVPGLRAHEVNRLGIDPRQLPLEARLADSMRSVVPGRRSGMLIDFAVAPAAAATFTAVTAGGAPLPAGTMLAAGGRHFPVGRAGRVYVEDVTPGMRLGARIAGRRCTITIHQPPPAGPLPELGRLVCAE